MEERFDSEAIREELEGGPGFYSIEDAAKLLDVNYFTIYRCVRTGLLDAVKIGPKCWRIPRAALEQYLQDRNALNLD